MAQPLVVEQSRVIPVHPESAMFVAARPVFGWLWRGYAQYRLEVS
jgi:hypothetical protein